jgi:FAD/FMN-containing dehydrogenase
MKRRDFVKLAGTTGAGLALGGAGVFGCAPAAPGLSPRRAGELDERAIREFAAGLHGSLIRPSDAEYQSARRIWNARFDRRPALIARCADAADVQRAVDFARAERFLVAVRGGGHSFAGYSTCDDGLVIDLSRMKGLRVDRERRIVRAEPGLVFKELAGPTYAVGLALALGGCGDVGVAGFTLGGGESEFSPKFGLGCDNLVSADVVLADGRLVTASAEANPDLFWALRGGGGNFGVVTALRLRAHPLTQNVAGRLIYDIAQAPAVMRAYRGFAPNAPDELDVGFEFSLRQDGPSFALRATYAGDAASAEPVLRTLRSFANPTADTVTPIALARKPAAEGPPPGLPGITRGAFLPELPDEVIDAVTALGAHIPPAADMELNHLHGAISRVPLAATAFPLRQPGFDCFAAAAWLRPAQRDAVIGWVQGFYDALRPHASGTAYVNLLGDGEDERVKAAYGPQYARLAALKRKYDPDNLFRLYANVLPDG